MDRREFIKRTTFFTVAAATGTLAGCGGGSGDASFGKSGAYTFPQGVASGDPRDTSAVFWTRVIPAAGGAISINVRLDVATDAGFQQMAAQVQLSADPVYDNTVRAKITGLSPSTTYYYRFVADTDTSPSGKTKTAPSAGSSNSRVRFAYFTCQDWSINHWGALALMAQETDLDFIVHLGDYIYEAVGAAYQAGSVESAHPPIKLPDGTPLPLQAGGNYATTLADYRTLYRTYRGDMRLQALHQAFPLIAIWDDHEFTDDSWQDHETYTLDNPEQLSRRRVANQAWFEYTPVDMGDVSFDLNNPSFQNIRIYRDFHFGQLVHLVMTDERLYRTQHPVGWQTSQTSSASQTSSPIGVRYFVDKATLASAEQQYAAAHQNQLPTMLGADQTTWWKNTLQTSTATWKVWGNEVMLNRLWIDPVAPLAPVDSNPKLIANCDSWDGYPTQKADLMGFLANNNIKNVMAITGDLHAYQCGVVRGPDPTTGVPVLVDFVTAGISSSSFYSYVKSGLPANDPRAALVSSPAVFDTVFKLNNPDLVLADHDAQGYASVTVTPDAFTVVFKKVDRTLTAAGAIANPAAIATTINVAVNTLKPVVS
ncbi:Phosphodiesterase/alkaline phosphatase D [Collimonas arenae]|uniref:Phosphodiesterase/alkaline phosphatase D n=1 Tax=Collimonas arenae TaxID=279058 RepID=A0A0A1FG12_9BURK|nr:alkaline phosphatase D family protein [Collimonas arenae]AIY41752.1 Phosphodiesterase/alkaline phosphatase D [Collimonas arenae]